MRICEDGRQVWRGPWEEVRVGVNGLERYVLDVIQVRRAYICPISLAGLSGDYSRLPSRFGSPPVKAFSDLDDCLLPFWHSTGLGGILSEIRRERGARQTRRRCLEQYCSVLSANLSMAGHMGTSAGQIAQQGPFVITTFLPPSESL